MSNLQIIEFKKFLWQPNWTRPTALSNYGCPQNFFSSSYFQIGRHVVLLHIVIICILRNTHQKASSYNFNSQMSYSQLEEQTMFCEKKNDTTNQKLQRCVSSVSKFPPFIGTCSLQRLYFVSCFADIQWEKFLRKSFSRKKVQNISEIEVE